MSVEMLEKYTLDYIESFSKQNNEPNWMKTLRDEALVQSERLEMPKPDKTNISQWDFTSFSHQAEAEEISSLADLPDHIKKFVDMSKEEQNLVILKNQHNSYQALSDQLKEKGVIFTDIFTAMQEHPDLVQKYYLTEAVNVDEHKLTALHAALIYGGIFLYVPRNVVIETTIQAIFWQEDADLALFNHV